MINIIGNVEPTKFNVIGNFEPKNVRQSLTLTLTSTFDNVELPFNDACKEDLIFVCPKSRICFSKPYIECLYTCS